MNFCFHFVSDINLQSCHLDDCIYNLSIVPILQTNVLSSNPDNGEVYSIQHYVIKFVSDLQQVGGFHQVLRFLSTNITERHVESSIRLVQFKIHNEVNDITSP
jgi:hypothetical protein